MRKRRRIDRKSRLTKRRFPVALIIILAVILSALIALLIGNALKSDAEKYERLKNRQKSTDDYDVIVKTDVPEVQCYNHSIGSSLSNYQKSGADALSVVLREENGKLHYNSATEKALGFGQNGSTDLPAYIEKLKSNGFYVSAVFYSDWQSAEDKNVRKVFESYELSLISEISAAGVDDIAIIGLEVNPENCTEVCGFLKDADLRAGKCAIGAALDIRTVQLSDSDVYLAERVMDNCDFSLLDLRLEAITADEDGEKYTVSALLDKFQFYITAFSMRLLFDSDTISVRNEAAERGNRSWQMAG